MNQSHHQLLALLADGQFHSGTELGEKLSISRAAISQKVRQLEEYGLVIHSVKGKGHRLPATLELLNKAKLDSGLVPAVRNRLISLEVFSEIDSTNRYLSELIGTENIHCRLALAEYQSAGRGRHGNSWISPFASGICLSLGWHFPVSPEPLTVISLGTGVAIIRALQRLGITDAGLKWPNDIFVNGKKLGGILVEMRAESAGPCNAIIGIGLNYAIKTMDVDAIDQPWTDILSVSEKHLSRNDCAAIIINNLVMLLEKISQTEPASIMKEWRTYDCMKGKLARLILPDETLRGRILDIDDHGALMMEINHQVRRFHIGEISMRVE